MLVGLDNGFMLCPLLRILLLEPDDGADGRGIKAFCFGLSIDIRMSSDRSSFSSSSLSMRSISGFELISSCTVMPNVHQ